MSSHTVNVTQNHVHIVSPNAYRILPIPVNGITDLTVIPGYEWEPLYWVLPSAIRGDQVSVWESQREIDGMGGGRGRDGDEVREINEMSACTIYFYYYLF